MWRRTTFLIACLQLIPVVASSQDSGTKTEVLVEIRAGGACRVRSVDMACQEVGRHLTDTLKLPATTVIGLGVVDKDMAALRSVVEGLSAGGFKQVVFRDVPAK